MESRDWTGSRKSEKVERSKVRGEMSNGNRDRRMDEERFGRGEKETYSPLKREVKRAPFTRTVDRRSQVCSCAWAADKMVKRRTDTVMGELSLPGSLVGHTQQVALGDEKGGIESDVERGGAGDAVIRNHQ